MAVVNILGFLRLFNGTKEMSSKELLPVSIVLFVGAVDEFGIDLWMQTRKENGPMNGLWEFPGGKIEVGETPIDAAIREVKEEVLPSIVFNPIFFKFHPYEYKDRTIGLYVYFSKITKEELPQTTQTKWFRVTFKNKSSDFFGKIPSVNHLIIDEVVDYLDRQNKAGTLELAWGQ